MDIINRGPASALKHATLACLLLGLFVAVVTYRWLRPKPLPGIPYNAEATGNLFGDLPSLAQWQKTHGESRRWFQAQFEKLNSPLVQVFVYPFKKPEVLLGDHREIRDILLRRHKEFDRGSKEPNAFGALLPQQFLSIKTPTPKFKFHKELMKDLMLPQFLSTVSGRFDDSPTRAESKPRSMAQRSIARPHTWWICGKRNRILPNRDFDVKSDLYKLAYDIIMAISFGFSDESSSTKAQLNAILAEQQRTNLIPDSQTNTNEPYPFSNLPLDAEGQAVADLTESVSVGYTSPIPYLHTWLLLRLPPLRSAVKIKEKMTKRQIDAAVSTLPPTDEEAQKRAKTAVEYLVFRERASARKMNREPDFHARYIYDELLGYIIGGHDTTSNSFAWALQYLADVPGVQDKLRARMRTAFADAAAARDGTGTQTRQLTLDEIIKTPNPYLEAVIEEIFRFSVVIPIVSRMATVDTTILGHPIPKGTEVVFCFNGPDFLKPGVPLPPVDASKRSETSKASTVGDWNPDDVDKFIPERWMDVDADGNEVFNALKGPMLSFGGGPRGCFGKRLAYLEMRVVLTLVVWNFELLPILPSRRPVGILENITVEPSEVLVRMKSLVG